MSFASPAGSNPSFSMSSYMVPSARDSSNSEIDDEIASLPSESTTDSDLETLSDDYSDAEAEWRESIEQLELLLTMVLVPFVGKYLGRRCAYWGMLSTWRFSWGYANGSCRLDKVHGVEVPGRGRCSESRAVQGCRCDRGCCKPIKTRLSMHKSAPEPYLIYRCIPCLAPALASNPELKHKRITMRG